MALGSYLHVINILAPYKIDKDYNFLHLASDTLFIQLRVCVNDFFA